MVEKQWISIHVYYSQPWNELLVKRIMPFVHPALETGLVEHFFFLRYWHKGPHIRLRFYGQKDQLETILIPNITTYLEDYFEFHPSYRKDPTYPEGFPESEKWLSNNSVQVIPYKPELHRYGGDRGVRIAEKQFDSSSRTVFQKFLEKDKGWNYEDAMAIGVLLHISMVHGMRLDKTEAVQFFNMFSQSWMPRVIASKKRAHKDQSLEEIRNKISIDFQRSFRAQKDQIVPYITALWDQLDQGLEFEEPYMNEWYNMQTEVGRELVLLQSSGGLKPRPETMKYTFDVEEAYTEAKLERWMHMADYMHMTNNRLGILNRDESYLAFLLTESLQRIL